MQSFSIFSSSSKLNGSHDDRIDHWMRWTALQSYHLHWPAEGGRGLQQVEDGLQEGLQGLFDFLLTMQHSWIAVHVSVQHHLCAAVPSCITMAGSVSVPFRPDVTSWEGAGVPLPSPLGWSKSLARQGGSPPSLPWRGRRGVGRGGRGRRGRTGSSPVWKWVARPPHQTLLPSGSALPPPSRPETNRFNFFGRKFRRFVD